MSKQERMTADMFPTDYRDKMIRAYPVIADMTRDDYYVADGWQRDVAFERILGSRNLRRTHEMFLEAGGAGQ